MSRILLVAALMWALSCAPAEARERVAPIPIPPLQLGGTLQQVVASQITLVVASGRIVHPGNWPDGRGSSNATLPGGQESLSFSRGSTNGSLMYRRVGPQGDLTLDFDSEGRFHFIRQEKERAASVPVELTQTPDKSLVLTIGPPEHQQTYRAATLWHLAVIEPEICRSHVYPVLDLLRPQWQIGRKAAQIEATLVKQAVEDWPADRQPWADLVKDLGSDQPAKRNAAEHRLRAGGPAALAYLQQLDPADLNAEQQARIRHIQRAPPRKKVEAQPKGDDTPEQAARLLAGDPSIWLALLSRPDAAARRAAAKRLGTLLGGPIEVDPAADPANQKAARDALRARIEKAACHGP